MFRRPKISSLARPPRDSGVLDFGRLVFLGAMAGGILAIGTPTHAAGTLRGGSMSGSGSSSSAAATSQTATSATAATSQAMQTSVLAQHAQASMNQSVAALQALQAAQAAAHTTALNGANNLGADPNHPGQTLPNVPDGLTPGGLVPGVAGTDPSNPSTAATTIPVTLNSNGTSSVTLSGDSAITLPTGTTGSQITVSGSGTVGTITTGTTITPITAGVATTVAPGSTISITQSGGATVTFASGSTGIPATFSTYNYGAAGTTAPVPGSWSGIGGLTQSTYSPTSGQTTGQTTVTITQTAQQALLTWQSFNIGKNTTLDFDQSQGGANVSQWVAINQITDPSLVPSQILGAIQAPGQVYVINQNGIIFGGSSQVNVGALTASSLALNPAYIDNGLLNDAGNDFEFQFSSLFTTITEKTTVNRKTTTTTVVQPLWTAPPAIPVNGTETVSSVPTGDITVQAGAQLTSPTNAENQGGRIALVAPNVTNDGTISTPQGQTILAAGLQVGFAAHNSNDASLRGLDVYVGQVSGLSSTLPTGTFTFNGLPNNDPVTFTGDGEVGTYSTDGGVTLIPIMAGVPTTIPIGSTVTLTSGTAGYNALTGGVATNAGNTFDAQGNLLVPGGDIEAPLADVTIAGSTVNQMGIINSLTSVTLNGRIDLLADYDASAETLSGVTSLYPFATGAVNLGSGSVTQILPDLSSTDTAIGTELAVSSLINIQGQSIEMFPGSLILAPSATAPSSTSSDAFDLAGAPLTSGVTLNAGSWYAIGNALGAQTTVFSNNDGTIALDSGSTIDVSGSENVAASVSENIIPVQLRSTELANSPLQLNGALRGDTVYVDIRNTGVYDGTPWVGTPIGDVSGYVNDVGHTAGELTTTGGTVALNAGTSVSIGGAGTATVNGNTVNEAAATINVSGGWINYAGANVTTTQVVTGGQVINISQATPDLVYQGIYTGYTETSAKWGVSQTYANSLLSGTQYDPGYVQGGNGGGISITAPSMNLGGNLYGNTVAGTLQRTPDSTLDSTYAGAAFLPTTLAISGVPGASSLDISFLQHSANNVSDIYLATSPDVSFQTDAYISQNAPAANQILLSQDIVNTDGFGKVAIDTSASGTIDVPADVALATVPGGSLSFVAANIDIEGSISAPGGGTDGGLNFEVLDIAPSVTQLQSTPGADSTRGNFTLGPSASLSSTGLLVDDLPTSSSAYTLPFATTGGAITISGFNVDLMPGSTIDVSGGVAISPVGQVTYGNAGRISILGGQDPQYTSLVLGGQLTLGATLTGYSGNVGGSGSLTIQAPLVQVGGTALQNGDSSTNPLVAGETSVTGNGTTLLLSSPFFNQGGFGTFNIEGLGQIETGGGTYLFDAAGDPIVSPAVLITSGTVIDPIVQSSIADVTGSGVTLAPQTATQARLLLPSQRSAANLTFNAEGVSSGYAEDGPPLPGGGTYQNSSGGGGILVTGDLIMDVGSIIETDPEANSSHGVSLLAARGTIGVLGSITTPGGTINITGGNTSSLSNNQLLVYQSSPDVPFPTVDLGPDSVLSTAGTIEQTYSSLGYDTGVVLPGGSIVVTGNIVGESGAVLNVSGTAAVLDETPNATGMSLSQLTTLAPMPTHVDSNGGSIALNAKQILACDSTLIGAAGGPYSQGGSLSVSSGFAVTASPDATAPLSGNADLVVTQNGINNGYSLPAGYATGLAVLDGQPVPTTANSIGLTVNDSVSNGQPVYSYFAASPNLFVSTAADKTLSDNGGRAGGFGSLSLAGTVYFNGPVNITTSNSLNVAMSSGTPDAGEEGGVIYANAPVVLTAPYVALNSYASSYNQDLVTGYPAATTGVGTLTINANVLADVGNISLQNIGTLTFNSNPAEGGDIRGVGTLQVADQINLNAGQIYPPTESTFTIEATTVAITSPTGQPLPSLPLSAGGTLNIDATTIEQGGVLRAPFGVINLGNSTTQNVTLSAGSITSVSAVDPTTGLGVTIPYGIIDANGDWYDPDGNNITLTGPPSKAINVNGQNVNILTGSTIDLTGGGDLYAYQFTPGTGGTNDILASLGNAHSSTSFAVIPGYTLDYAPEETYAANQNLETNNVADVGYFNSSLQVGEQVYLNASDGLAAGTYTLLPARYALLPGAFLVTPATGSAPGASIVQADGTSLVSGYTTSGLNPTLSGLDTGFEIYSQSQVLTHAPYTISLADTFFPASAANNDLSVPLLPYDAGQLVLDATESMTIQGMLLSQPGAGGLGGQVDIASPEAIYIVGPGETGGAPATGALVLDSAQLTGFGAASLLIGGYRTTTDTGTAVTVTTNDVVVDNGGSSTVVNGVTVDGLAAPDITLVSSGTIDVEANSQIEQLGSLSTPAQNLTLQGNGVLLRVSSDSAAQVSRQNVTAGDATSNLIIGDGVKITNSNGGAVGSLTLDSTSLVTISQSTTAAPLLSSNTLTLDGGFINLELGTPATAPTSGLIINQPQLLSLLASTQSLSLLSYSSIALYGSGSIGGVTTDASGNSVYQESSISLHADDIYYADTANSSGISINAQKVSLDNLAGGTLQPALTGLGTGNLTVNAQTITLGSNALRLDQFGTVTLNASSAILLNGLGSQGAGSDVTATPASLAVGGDLVLDTPLITGAVTADQSVTATTTTTPDESITATGSLVLEAPAGAETSSITPAGLAANLSLTGASVDQESGSVVLHSGSLALQATDGDVIVNGTLDVSGVAQTLFSLTKYTNGGQITLGSSTGNVSLGSSAMVNVSAVSGLGTTDSGAGDAGGLTVNAAGLFDAVTSSGAFASFAPGQIEGNAGTVTGTPGGAAIAQGTGGTLTLDVGSLDVSGGGNGLVSSVESGLAGFSGQNIRDHNDARVTVDGTVVSSIFNLSADQGSIAVTGTINASGVTGGSVDLAASGSVTLGAGSLITVAANQLNDAGQGGSVTLEAGSYEGTSPTTSTANIDLITGAEINLSVNNGIGGTLLLRAPQVNGTYVADSTYTPVAVNAMGGGTPGDVAIDPIDSTVIHNASSVVAEGFYVQDALTTGSALIDNYEIVAGDNASAFMGNAVAIQTRIFGSVTTGVNIQPGEEIDNSLGGLELQNTWDLSTLRYGAPLMVDGSTVDNAAGNQILSEPGVLTLRAAGDLDIDFGASLTDGFDGSLGVNNLNPLLPTGSQSWSMNLTSGADFTAANSGQVQSQAQLQTSGLGGTFQLGYQDSSSPIVIAPSEANSLSTFFQTVRTGTGNITINSGGDVLILNNLATIYTAGSQVDPTLGGTFAPPAGIDANGDVLPATYSAGGGNVSITAQGNIAHETYSADGSSLVADSSAELPTNWLDRDGSVDGSQVTTSTSWWVDFTNFFEGVGALGGGNVTLNAGGSVVNVDVAVPTNARLVNGQLNQLGGGDLTVTAGDNIDAGVYYIEDGVGTLSAGNNILTNSTRAAVTIGSLSAATPLDWLPTTLFLGQGSFNVSAGGDLLLGPVANPFLLPQSYNNIAPSIDVPSEISYFSTYAATDAVNVASLDGTVTVKDFAVNGQGSLLNWYSNVLDADPKSLSPGSEISDGQPWLTLAEAIMPQHVKTYFAPAEDTTLAFGSPNNVFGGVTALLPPTLRVTAFSGDIDLVGGLTLTPSAIGTVDLVADDSINAFQLNNMSNWASGLVNLSDADPSALPSPAAPLSSGAEIVPDIAPYFTETGATEGITLQTKQDLHADINGTSLHANDPNPVYIYAGSGDISGLTLFSAKQAQVIAGQDITDVGLYIQNNSGDDISLVDAGRDIIAYDASSPLRQDAGTNLSGYDPLENPVGSGASAPNSGDIQISGPGTLEVLAGRNFTLGDDAGQNPNNKLPDTISASSADNNLTPYGLFTGLTSVGGQRNPALPVLDGANIVAASGLGTGVAAPVGLQDSTMDFSKFITDFLNPSSMYAATYLPDLASYLGVTGATNAQVWDIYDDIADSSLTSAEANLQQSLTTGLRDSYALDIFYLALRDAGRAKNDPSVPSLPDYATGYQAIADLFPTSNTYSGNVDVTSREIKTSNGGDINLLLPGGQLTVGINLPSGQAVDQGILTVDGGNISIFANNDVSVGTSRIFTLHGGNEIIWSTVGNIAAGASSKTVVSAPPTRVVVDPTSGAVETDLAGLATGGGIGVLVAVAGGPSADVDLIAPVGIINAGDAGIRASGNLNIAALKVVNADNISVGGKSSGVPTTSSVNIGAAVAASSAAGSSQAAASNSAAAQHPNPTDATQDLPSIITVEVLGYGGGDQD